MEAGWGAEVGGVGLKGRRGEGVVSGWSLEFGWLCVNVSWMSRGFQVEDRRDEDILGFVSSPKTVRNPAKEISSGSGLDS